MGVHSLQAHAFGVDHLQLDCNAQAHALRHGAVGFKLVQHPVQVLQRRRGNPQPQHGRHLQYAQAVLVVAADFDQIKLAAASNLSDFLAEGK